MPLSPLHPPTLADIHDAKARIAPYAHRTPVLTCESINQFTGCKVFMKCENFQRVGAFKFRGACNAVLSLRDEELKHGVVCHSSGNHAQALALAAKLRGTKAYIVMPSNSPAVKKAAVAGYGGIITLCEPTLAAREATQAKVIEQTGATEVHPFNNSYIIAGQGTAALELLDEVPDLDVIIAPVGGGGLLSGTSIATKGTSPRTRVIGAEPELADDAYRSLQAGKVMPAATTMTIADGLRTSLSELTFSIIRQNVDQIVTVKEQTIIDAMRFVWERAKIIIEPSCATTLAILWERKIDLRGIRIGIIISGGNVDLAALPWQAK
ncbi:MAG: pyridoxal-phosphate dependent enzyme [Phycisphaerales bacterium]